MYRLLKVPDCGTDRIKSIYFSSMASETKFMIASVYENFLILYTVLVFQFVNNIILRTHNVSYTCTCVHYLVCER